VTGQTEAKIRLWIATVGVIVLIVAVWKFIDYRMRPPPPPGEAKTATGNR